MDVWYQHAFRGQTPLVQWELKSHSIFKRGPARGEEHQLAHAAARRQRGKNGLWKFVADPPKLTRVDSDTATPSKPRSANTPRR